MKKRIIKIVWICLYTCLIISFYFCKKSTSSHSQVSSLNDTLIVETPRDSALFTVVLARDIKIKNYFAFLDSLVVAYDSLLPYELTEHLIVRANPWIMDTLENTDYYRMMERDSFVYDQKELIVLPKSDTLFIPDSLWAARIIQKQENTVIDLNIPEFSLRIIENGRVLYDFPVRVGRNETKYLAMAGHRVDLKTLPGEGIICRINRNPAFINPTDGKRFTHTRRDDNRTTLMPLIPYLEPEIDGHRYGHLIHPTTNPKTLGKAYSNGCIGTSEAAAWRIYYYAPVGTRVDFRYDLEVIDDKGDTIQLKDIYRWKNKEQKSLKRTVAGLLFIFNEKEEVILVK